VVATALRCLSLRPITTCSLLNNSDADEAVAPRCIIRLKGEPMETWTEHCRPRLFGHSETRERGNRANRRSYKELRSVARLTRSKREVQARAPEQSNGKVLEIALCSQTFS
jgi:hypothetical protein